MSGGGGGGGAIGRRWRRRLSRRIRFRRLERRLSRRLRRRQLERRLSRGGHGGNGTTAAATVATRLLARRLQPERLLLAVAGVIPTGEPAIGAAPTGARAYAAAWPWWGCGWGWPYYALLRLCVVPVTYEVDTTSLRLAADVLRFAAEARPRRRRHRSNLWYYCTEPAGYYPYVQTCNRAWIPVTPPSVGATAMKPFRLTAIAGVLALALAGCASVPSGPRVVAMPGPNKSLDQFQADQASCQQYAQASLGGRSPAENARTARSAARRSGR